ncbi:MAG: MarR family transcriptional regulator [Candidatus Nanohaloarchaeota archaeon QJJ-7]|nr:MarR family transcriptional regulator [Candidatus Nanohaloarchaeota archaeon QJJ-7]
MRCPPELTELLKTLYNLSPAESEVFASVCGEEWTVEELSEALERDRSTVQRYLSSLQAAGLISRRTGSTSERGRSYVYFVSDKDELKDRIKQRLDDWEHEKVEKLEEL